MADPLRPSGPQIPGSLMGEIQSEVAVEATPLLSFVLRNSRIIVTCIVLLVLVIAGVGGWQWHQTRVEREAHLELGRILVSTQGPERIAALETFLPAAPSAMKSGVQLEIATTALGLEQYGKAAEAYAAVAAADPKGSIGMMAAINQADLQPGKYAEALAVFDSLEKSAPESLRPAILKVLYRRTRGQADRALAAYESIATSLGCREQRLFPAKIAELSAHGLNAYQRNGLCQTLSVPGSPGYAARPQPVCAGLLFGKPCGSDPFPPRFKHEGRFS
ncbi:MAG: tetratricopeptide repeat protein [Bilophila wadsworthia]